MMQLVTGDVISQGANADFVVIRRAAPQPRIAVQVFEQIDIRFARIFELFGQIGQSARTEIGVGHITVLVEAGERRSVVTRETKSAVSEDAFGVDQMAYHLFDAPLARGVAQIALTFAQSSNQAQRGFDLKPERRDDLAFGNERNVFVEIRRVFCRIWSVHSSPNFISIIISPVALAPVSRVVQEKTSYPV